MSMSSTTVVTVAGGAVRLVECAVFTVMGRPDDFFDQIKACKFKLKFKLKLKMWNYNVLSILGSKI